MLGNLRFCCCLHHAVPAVLQKHHKSIQFVHREQNEVHHVLFLMFSSLNVIFFRGKPNLLDMGSLLIKPVQRIMKYPLLLAELWNATPTDHPDNRPLQEALTTVKVINININEFKRRKDIGETYTGYFTISSTLYQVHCKNQISLD